MPRISVTLDLSDKELRDLADDAGQFNWRRENPRKSWTEREYREAARFAATCHIHSILKGRV